MTEDKRIDGAWMRDLEQGELNSMAAQSVEDAGGMINMSGIYPPNHDLIKLFRDAISRDEIRLEGEVLD
jgi:hypothetical protein